MGRVAKHVRLSQALADFLPLAALSFCISGCHNTCVFGTLNSPGSTVTVQIGNPPPSCSLTTANGAVRVEIASAAQPASAAPSSASLAGPQFAHLYVTLAGIDAHRSPDADDHSPDWQPLAPQLEAQLIQVDLLARDGAESAADPFPESFVPAGVYRQARLRLAMVPVSPESRLEANEKEPALQANPCGAGIFHCAVTSDGRIQPLALASGSVLRIPPSADGRWLYVPPDGTVTLRIEFDPDRSFLWPSADALRLIPQFRVHVEPSFPTPQT